MMFLIEGVIVKMTPCYPASQGPGSVTTLQKVKIYKQPSDSCAKTLKQNDKIPVESDCLTVSCLMIPIPNCHHTLVHT